MNKVWLLVLVLGGCFVFGATEALSAPTIEIPKFADKVDVKNEANQIGENIAIFLYVLAGIVAVFGVVIGGIKIVDNRAEDGWQNIKNALLGTTVVFFAGTIVHVFA